MSCHIHFNDAGYSYELVGEAWCRDGNNLHVVFIDGIGRECHETRFGWFDPYQVKGRELAAKAFGQAFAAAFKRNVPDSFFTRFCQ